jgi:hypothetical protein
MGSPYALRRVLEGPSSGAVGTSGGRLIGRQRASLPQEPNRTSHRHSTKSCPICRSGFACRSCSVSRALNIAKDLKLNGEPDPTGPYHIALAQAESGDYRAARETLRRNAPDPSIEADDQVEVIALTQARAGDFSRALLMLEVLPQSDTLTRSRALQEILRLQVESGDEENVLDLVDGSTHQFVMCACYYVYLVESPP